MNTKINIKFMILILINVVIFFIFSYQANMGVQNSNYDLLGVQKGLVLENHQFYRIITYMFMHGDLTHLLFNMVALYSISEAVIAFTDESFSLITYFISGIVSGLGIIFFTNTITVGSSGAVYGLFGVLIYNALKQRKYGYDDLFKSLIPVIVINLAISILPGVSLTGHVFGLITGLILSYIYDVKKRREFW